MYTLAERAEPIADFKQRMPAPTGGGNGATARKERGRDMTGSIREVGAFARSKEWDAGDGSAGPPDDESAARQTRLAAAARYDAFVASGTTSDTCRSFDRPDHNYDRCVTDSIASPVLFQKEDLDADAVDPSDIRQGMLGDCHVLASLAAIAQTAAGRAMIRSAVVENKNDAGAVTSYTVTLHAPEGHVFGQTTYRDVPVTVDGPYVIGHAETRSDGSHNEIWPLVVEKACAKYLGGYNKLGHGGTAAAAMTLLTGRETTSMSLLWPDRLAKAYEATDLQGDLANGKIVVLSTRANLGAATGRDAWTGQNQLTTDTRGLVSNHAYFVKGTESRDGKLLVNLGNPWGDTDPAPVPFDELTTWFSDVSVGSIP